MGFLVKGIKSVVKAVVGVASKVVNTIVGPIVGLFKPKKQAKASSNLRLNKSLEPEAYRKIVFGRTASGLDVRFWQVWGAKGTLYDEVLAAAGHRINGFKETYFGDELAINAAGAAVSKWAGVVTRETRLGTDDQVGMNVAGGSLWNAQSAPFTGVAHVKYAWVPTEEKLPNGVPSRYTQIVEGALLYDPRRDSTVGGSGTHRITDRSTWSYATLDAYGQPIGRNNALQVLWYLLGWYVKNPVSGELMLVAGRGVEPSDINIANFVQAANDCEAAGYYTDCILSTEDSHTSNEDKLTSGGLMGQLIDEGGLWSYYVNVDDTANVALEITDNDVIEGASTTWNEYRPISEQYQQVSGKFIDPSSAALFQTNGYPAVRDTNYEALTGLKRRKTQDFEVVQDVMLAQKLARLLLNMGQYQAEFASSFLYRALQARVWSIVRYRSERFGWNKLFRVYRHDISVDSGIAMLLREIHPSIWGAGSVVQPEAPSAGVKYDPRQEIVPTGIVYASQTITSGNGFAQDGVIIGWAVPPANTKYTEVRLRKQGEQYWQTYSPNKGDSFVSIVPIVSGTMYEFQVRHVSIHEVPGPWTPDPPMVFAGGTSSTTPWVNISDPFGTKPEDNATVGAPDGTAVGGRPVETLLTQVDATLKGIDDLEAIYGSTASAAQSAEVAEQAAKDAKAAYDAADAAKAGALANAQAAAVSAGDADNFAKTASGKATVATQKADEAGQSAVNASASADIASTQAGQAEIFKSQAATSASDAEGSKNAAVISQGVAASEAERAGREASASATSAQSAATSRQGAADSASAAITAQTAAETASGQASTSASQASSSSDAAAIAQTQAENAATFAGNSATASSNFAAAASDSQASAAESARLAAQYANGGGAAIEREAEIRAQEDAALSRSIETVSAGFQGLDARVTEAKTAASDALGRSAARFKVETVAGNNRAQLSVYADANGGAGVDIVGDTTFRGRLAVGFGQTGRRIEISDNKIEGFYANGSPSFRIS